MRYTSYVAVDIETTGFDQAKDKIIEIAAVRVKGGKVTETFSKLINPGFSLTPEIVKITGITDEMLANAPSIESVLPEFFAFVGKSAVLGHNIRGFDVPFINEKAKKLNLTLGNRTIDTLPLSRKAFPEWKHHRLSDLVKNLDVKLDSAHRALDDAIATHECYQKLQDTLEQASEEQIEAELHTEAGKKSVSAPAIKTGKKESITKKVCRKLWRKPKVLMFIVLIYVVPVTLVIDIIRCIVSLFAKKRTSDWSVWQNVHEEPEQKERIERAKSEDMKILIRKKDGTAIMEGESEKRYSVSFESCTCNDFTVRKKPCKHMYRLAMDSGVFDFVEK